MTGQAVPLTWGKHYKPSVIVADRNRPDSFGETARPGPLSLAALIWSQDRGLESAGAGGLNPAIVTQLTARKTRSSARARSRNDPVALGS